MNKSAAHILVADDAPLIRGMLVRMLRKYGYYVGEVEDGERAIQYFQTYHPDLILMDADMPVLDGVVACSQIKQLPNAKYVPVVIVTSFVEREWIDKAYAAGATDYITKPVNWDVLRNRVHYILQAKRAEEALFDEKEKAQITLASIGDGVVTTDAQGLVEYINPIANKLTGWSVTEAKGLPLNQVYSIIEETTQQTIHFPVERCLKQGETVDLSHNTVLVHRDQATKFAIEDTAAPITDRKGKIIGLVLVFRDVTENREMTRKLAYQANHDPLTSLYNRHAFMNGLMQKPHESPGSMLVYMDLDQFKTVNDTCGHEAGDQLLKNVALILKKKITQFALEDNAMLARLGGDEFSLLLSQCSLEAATKLSQQLCECIQNFKFFWEKEGQKHVFAIGISIGILPIPSDCSTSHKNLLAMADAACYAAKNAGRNQVHIYQKGDEDETIQSLSLINENLEDTTGFRLFSQTILPLNATPDQQLRYEILLRMKNQKGDWLRPGAFLSTAERYNLMPAIDRRVITELMHWFEKSTTQLSKIAFISINLSHHSLTDKDFFAFLTSFLKKYPKIAAKICFEIPETIVITYFSAIHHFIHQIKPLGCKIIIDNFGVGMLSFHYLKILAVDFVKIDKNLSKNILKSVVDLTIIQSIITVTEHLNIQTIATCIEEEEVCKQLQTLKIDYIQGHWLGKPSELN